MWITSDVDLPQELIQAHTEGRLVFFVGAGASVDSPSGLPLFAGLAEQLADLANVPFGDSENLDRFLGSLPEGFETHRHARDLIANAESRPNSVHESIVGLASSMEPLRIVTTNFDEHLRSASANAGLEDVEQWIGPALPLGDEFTGIVHLHGSVTREPTELVLTDGDFGRAYVTRAWATRFLLAMFQEFEVLFIGYSHDDPIMRYLALGLPSKTSRSRYALVSQSSADDQKWSRLGIKVIPYPVEGRDHSALAGGLRAWERRARMGQTEHRARIREIVQGGPSLMPVERDYILDRLSCLEGAWDFKEAASDIEQESQLNWLRWMEDLPSFKAHFEGTGVAGASTVLVRWFCDTFVASPTLNGAALQTVQHLGQTFSEDLFRHARVAAAQLYNEDAVAGNRWKVFLSTSVHGHTAPISSSSLLPYLPDDGGAECMSLLRLALRPHLKLERSWLADGSEDPRGIPSAAVRWDVEPENLIHHLRQAIEAKGSADLELELVLATALSAAYDMLCTYYAGVWDGDPLTGWRSAIEPHSQDSYHEPLDAIIDGLRTYGERAQREWPGIADRWWEFDRGLFQRLALHLVANDDRRSPDQKIEWLLDKADLYDYDLKHEIYQVLKSGAGGASEPVRDRLLSLVVAGPALEAGFPEKKRHAAYLTYNLLVWLSEVAPEWAEAGVALQDAQDANPNFGPSEHPDFNTWSESFALGETLPAEPSEFIHSLEEDVDLAVGRLLSRDYSSRSFDEPQWRDALSLVRQVVEVRPDLGIELWAAIKAVEASDEEERDLRNAVIEGWTKAKLGELDEAVIDLVGGLADDDGSVRTVSRFLLEKIRVYADREETPGLARMRRVAAELWSNHGGSFAHDEDDPVSTVPLFLNSWPGWLAQYWISEIDRQWRSDRDAWSGIDDEIRGALISMLEGSRPALDAVQPAVASELFFLFSADPNFTCEWVLPLFGEQATATLAWFPYLHNARFDDKLLAAGLLDSTILNWDRLDGLAGLRMRFFRFVGEILSFANVDVNSREKLLKQSVIAKDGAYTVEFAHSIVRLLSREEVNGGEVWKRWLRKHLKARLNGVPRSASKDELAGWANVVPHLGESMKEAMGMLGDHKIGLDRYSLLPDFSKFDLSTYGAVLVPHFAERVRNSEIDPGSFMAYELGELVDALRSAVGDAVIEPLLDAARDKGLSVQTDD